MFKYVICFVSFLLAFQSSAKELNERSIYQLTLAELFDIQVVSAASGVEQKVSSAPATVTIINKEQWQALGATSLTEVLSTVAGVHVGQPKFFSYYNTSLTFRGLSGLASGRVKLLIDGQPFENMQVSGLHWGFYMPLTGFSRVEVIKGSGSAVYGADAYAGIINLVSEQADVDSKAQDRIEFNGDIGVRVGSFEDLDVFSQSHLQYGQHSLQIGFDYTRSSDDPDKIAQTDVQGIFDSIYGTNASLAPGHFDQSYEVLKLLAKWQYDNWSVDYLNWRNFNIGIGVGAAQAVSEEGEMGNRFDRLTATYSVDDWLEGQLDFQYSYMGQVLDVNYDVFPDGAVLPIGSDGNISSDFSIVPTLFTDGFIGKLRVHGITNTASVTHVAHTDENSFYRVHLGYEKQTFKVNEAKNFGPGVLDGSQLVVDGQLTDVTNTPFVFIENINRNFWFASIHHHWQFSDDIDISMGIRFDDYSDFGSTTNPRFSFLWQATDKLSVKLFAGTAFKAPTIGQLYSRNNPSTIGNRALKEERISTLELGNSFEYTVHDDLIIGLNLFRYKAKDLIVYQADIEVGGRVAQNVGEQFGVGGELTLKWKPLANVTIDSHYSYLSAEDGEGSNIEALPNRMAYLGINWQISDKWGASISSKWVGARSRNASDSRADLSEYHLTTMSISCKELFDKFDGRLSAKNVFDVNATEPSDGTIANDLPLAGRQLLFELSHRF